MALSIFPLVSPLFPLPPLPFRVVKAEGVQGDPLFKCVFPPLYLLPIVQVRGIPRDPLSQLPLLHPNCLGKMRGTVL